MESELIIKVINKLNGSILPAGASHIDGERFDNLKRLCEVVSALINQIDGITGLEDRQEYSVKKSGQYASDFLKNL